MTPTPAGARAAGTVLAAAAADAGSPADRGLPRRGDPSDEVERHLLAARQAAELRRQLRGRARPRSGDRSRLTLGQRAADAVTGAVGTWTFLVLQSSVLAAWLVLNGLSGPGRWDPYPFILLNLVLSFQAAYTAPVMLMSAKRQATVDRERAEHDLLVNEKSEAEVEELLGLARAQLAQTRAVLDRLTTPESTSVAGAPP